MAAMTILNVSTLILSLNVILTLQAPVLNSRIRTKFTCLPRNGKDYGFTSYRKKDWKSCGTINENPLRYTAMQSHIGHSLGLPQFQLPNDE